MDLAAQHGVAFCAYAILHAIAANQGHKNLVLWGANTLVGKFNEFMGTDQDTFGLVLSDRIPIDHPHRYLRELRPWRGQPLHRSKTVRPKTADTEEAWQKFIARKEYHPNNVHFVVEKEWMGGAIYGNVFASRAHFLEYTIDFEQRLAAAKAIRRGYGVLIFCGTGFAWHQSNLEDFADFYLTGVHRDDDALALMEQHHIERKKIKLLQYRSFCISAPPGPNTRETGVSISCSRSARVHSETKTARLGCFLIQRG
jgi:hypothetical protein